MDAFVPGIAARGTPSDSALAAIETIDRRQSLALAYYLTQAKSPLLIVNRDNLSPVATCIASLR